MDGYSVVLRLAGTAITGRTSSNLDMSWDIFDETTADSAQNKEKGAGEFDWKLGVEGKLKATDTNSVTQLKTAGDARTPVAALFGRLSDDARRYSGNVLVANLSISAPINEAVTWTATLEGTGALAEGTYTTV